MANFLYDTGRQAFLTPVTVGAYTGQLDWLTGPFHGALLDITSYTPDQAAHNSVQDVLNAGATIYERAQLTGLAATSGDGIAFADDLVFPSVAGPGDAGAVVIYRDNATVDADNVLVAYIDTATNLPVTLNGGDVTVVWDNGSGRIFKL